MSKMSELEKYNWYLTEIEENTQLKRFIQQRLALNNLGQYHSDMIKKLERDACNLYNIHYPDQSPMSISIIDLVVENLPNLIQ